MLSRLQDLMRLAAKTRLQVATGTHSQERVAHIGQKRVAHIGQDANSCQQLQRLDASCCKDKTAICDRRTEARKQSINTFAAAGLRWPMVG